MNAKKCSITQSYVFILGLICSIVTSCGNIGKTTMNELSFTGGNRNEVCVTEGTRPYCGEFWSNEGKTVKMITNNYGIIPYNRNNINAYNYVNTRI